MTEERKKHFERPTSSKPPSLMNLSLLAIFFGLVAGFFGYLFGRSVMPAENMNYFNFPSSNNVIELDFNQPLTNLYEKNTNSIAGVYKDVSVVAAVGSPLFGQDDLLGSAVVVTSDGWLMTTDQVYTSQKNKVVLGSDIYDIKEVKVDEFANIVFIKIDASILQPINFQLTNEIKEGETLFSLTDLPNSLQHSFDTAVLQNSHYVKDKYLFTDTLDYWLDIDKKQLVDDSLAAPYFNLDGDLLGLDYVVDGEDLLIPSDYLRQSVRHLLSGDQRPLVGIRYVDMENNSGFKQDGNLIYHPSLTALSTKAYQAGLRLGDDIIAINNDVVASNKNITSILQNYRVGDTVVFKILRSGVARDIELTL